MRTCTVEGCERELRAKGLCQMHYKRLTKTGTLERYGVPNDPYVGTDLKTCRACGEAKSRSEFTRNQMAADGYKGRCKACENAKLRADWASNRNGVREKQLARYRKFKYGVDHAAIAALREHQDDKCALCPATLAEKFHVDHDHETGATRGLLCHRCNRALGFFDIEGLQAAIRYLQDPPMRQMARKKAL